MTEQSQSVAIVTRSYHNGLYTLCESLLTALPFPRYRLLNVRADTYFHSLHEFKSDWVVNLDEDAFLASPERLVGLLRFMAENDYDFCGIPDGGTVGIRAHNPIVPNAFFTILRTKKIRPLFNLEAVVASEPGEDLKAFLPGHLIRGEYEFDNFEPYYSYFFWLLRNGFRPLYLDGEQWSDGISTVLFDHLRQPFLLHCWYAREFETQADRFVTAHEACRSGALLSAT